MVKVFPWSLVVVGYVRNLTFLWSSITNVVWETPLFCGPAIKTNLQRKNILYIYIYNYAIYFFVIFIVLDTCQCWGKVNYPVLRNSYLVKLLHHIDRMWERPLTFGLIITHYGRRVWLYDQQGAYDSFLKLIPFVCRRLPWLSFLGHCLERFYILLPLLFI